MTLKLERYLSNSLTKQFKIAHLPIDVLVFKKDDIPENISSKILEQYGETYLEDSQYVIFFKGGIDKDIREKLFKQVDRALGGDKDKKKNANLLTVNDLKLLKMKDDEEDFGDDTQEEESGIQDQVNDIVNEPEDSEEAEEIPETTAGETTDNSDAIDDTLSDTSNDDEKEVEESINEDDEESDDTDDSSDSTSEEKPVLPTKYVFLKITLKK